MFATVFNHEDILTGHFFIYNKEAGEVLKELKLRIAKDKLSAAGIDPKNVEEADLEAYGTRLFRDMSAVADFWSSGWRIEQTLLQIDRVMEQDYARFLGIDPKNLTPEQREEALAKSKDLALFLRLKYAQSMKSESHDERAQVWAQIAQYKPEDIVKFFRERVLTEANERDEEKMHAYHSELERDSVFAQAVHKYEALQHVFSDNGIVLTHEEQERGITYYDKFKLQYGSLIGAIREAGLSGVAIRTPNGEIKKYPPQQVDFAKLANPVGEVDIKLRQMVQEVVGGPQETDRFITMMTEMQIFAKESIVSGTNGTLLKSTRFEELYTKTLAVDDAILRRLENPPQGSGLLPLSKMISSEAGADSLVRNAKDIQLGVEAFQNLLIFIRSENDDERVKAALKYADNMSIINSQFNKAECIRYTVGTYWELGKEYLIYDALGILKHPFRRPVSKLQEIYGPGGQVFTEHDLRQFLDEHRSELTHIGPKADQFVKALERAFELDGLGLIKRRSLDAIITALFFGLIEAVEIADLNPGGKH